MEHWDPHGLAKKIDKRGNPYEERRIFGKKACELFNPDSSKSLLNIVTGYLNRFFNKKVDSRIQKEMKCLIETGLP